MRKEVTRLQSYKVAGILIMLGFLTAAPLYAEVVDKIAVVVNNEFITQSEIDRQLEPVYEQYRTIYSGDELAKKLEEARQNIIGQLIDDKLILSEAKKLNIEVDDKDVEERVSEVKKQFNSQAEFEKALEEQGLTLKELRKRYKENIMSRRLIDQKIGSKVLVSPIEINEYYEKHIKEYLQPEEISLSNILLRPKKDVEVEKTLGLAKEILRRIREGGDFANLARKYSEGPNAKEGGLMGYVKKGDLLPEIEAVVFGLKEGETSDVIQTSLGYHIFKVEEKKERKIRELSEVQHKVEEAVFREKVRTRLVGWIEGLKNNAYIAFK